MKKLNVLLATLMISLSTIHAADIEKELMREEIRLLKERLSDVERRLETQTNEIGRTGHADSAITLPAESPNLSETSTQLSENENIDVDGDEVSFLDRLGGFALIKDSSSSISLSGNADIVYWYSDRDAKRMSPFDTSSQDTSDFVLDQVRLAIDLDIHEYVKGFIALQFEDYQQGSFAGAGGLGDTEDDGDLQVDEAYIMLGDWEFEEGLYGIFGKQYLPFGNVNDSGNFINDTFARQLYETRDTGLTVGHKYAGLDINLYAFNGRADEIDGFRLEDNRIKTWGGSMSYTMDEEDLKLKMGVSYINNLLQAQNNAAAAGLDFEGIPVYFDNDNRAYNVYGTVGIGPVWFSAEWVSAFSNLDRRDARGNKNIEPSALSLEGACTFGMGEYEVTLATKYEMNNDQDVFNNELKDVLGFGIASEIFDNTTLTINYEHYNLEESLNNGNMDLYLAELSIGF